MENVVFNTLSGSEFAFCASKGFACGFLIGFSGYILSLLRRSVKGIFTTTFAG